MKISKFNKGNIRISGLSEKQKVQFISPVGSKGSRGNLITTTTQQNPTDISGVLRLSKDYLEIKDLQKGDTIVTKIGKMYVVIASDGNDYIVEYTEVDLNAESTVKDTADEIGYDNEISNLAAENVQDAIDELENNKVNKKDIKYGVPQLNSDWTIYDKIPDEVLAKSTRQAYIQVGEELFIFGGLDYENREGISPEEKYTNKSYKYNFETKQWTELADRLYWDNEERAVYKDGYIYLFGGFQNGPLSEPNPYTSNKNYKYDILNDTFELLPETGLDVRIIYTNGAVLYDNKIYVFVCSILHENAPVEINKYIETTPYIYDLNTETWSKGASSGVISGFNRGNAILIDDLIYIYRSSHFKVYNPNEDEWVEDLPLPKYHGVHYGNLIPYRRGFILSSRTDTTSSYRDEYLQQAPFISYYDIPTKKWYDFSMIENIEGEEVKSITYGVTTLYKDKLYYLLGQYNGSVEGAGPVFPNVIYNKYVYSFDLVSNFISKIDFDAVNKSQLDKKVDKITQEQRDSLGFMENDDRIVPGVDGNLNEMPIKATGWKTKNTIVMRNSDGEFQDLYDHNTSPVAHSNEFNKKVDKITLENANMFKDVNYNNVNGVLTFTRYDDTTKEIDLPLELLVESGHYDEIANELVLVLANGSEIRIPVGNLLTDLDAHNIRFNGSGTNYLTDKTEVESAVKELDTRVKANTDRIENVESGKQDKLVPGVNITIDEDTNVISASGEISASGQRSAFVQYQSSSDWAKIAQIRLPDNNSQRESITFLVTANDSRYESRGAMVADFMLDFNAYFSDKDDIVASEFFTGTYGWNDVYTFFTSETYADKWGWMRTYMIQVADDQAHASKSHLEADDDATWRAAIDSFLNATVRTVWPASADYTNEPAKNGFNVGANIVSEVYRYQSREEMVADFMLDFNAYFSDKDDIVASEFFTGTYKWNDVYTFFTAEPYAVKWGWMRTYMIQVAIDQGHASAAHLQSNDDATWRGTIDSFLNETVRTTYPATVDYSVEPAKNGFNVGANIVAPDNTPNTAERYIGILELSTHENVTSSALKWLVVSGFESSNFNLRLNGNKLELWVLPTVGTMSFTVLSETMSGENVKNIELFNVSESATQTGTSLGNSEKLTIMTNAEIKAAYEANANTNAYTDEDKAKLDDIEDRVNTNTSYITANQSNITQLQANKQDKLTAGDNITIDENNVISVSGGIFNGELDAGEFGEAFTVELDAGEFI